MRPPVLLRRIGLHGEPWFRLGISLGLAALVWGQGVWPMARYLQKNAAERLSQSRALAHWQLDESPVVTRIDSLANVLVRLQELSRAAVPDAGASRILQEILGLAREAGIEVGDLATADPLRTEGLVEYPVTLRAQGAFSALVGFVIRLEDAGMAVAMRRMQIVPSRGERLSAELSLSVHVREGR